MEEVRSGRAGEGQELSQLEEELWFLIDDHPVKQ